MQDINKKQLIARVIADHVHKHLPSFSPDAHSDTSFSRLGLDSLGHVEISVVIEDVFGLKLDPEAAFNYPTLNALVDHVLMLLTSSSSTGE